MTDLPPAVAALVAAINNGDTDAFVEAFSHDAFIDDWGRQLRGHDGVRSWAETDAIGMNASMTVTAANSEGDTTEIEFDWSSNRFNGSSRAFVTVQEDQITAFRIPPH